MRGLTAGLVACALAIGACAPPPGRDALALRRTALGHMPPPEGSVLVSERYEPPEQSIDVLHSSSYTRIFATNTPREFSEAVAKAATAAGYNVPSRFRAELLINTGPGWLVSAPLQGEGVSCHLQFLDLDVSDWRSYGRLIDVGVWRYAAVLQIFDDAR